MAGAHATGAIWAACRLGVVELTGEKLTEERARLAEALQEAFQGQAASAATALSPTELMAQHLLEAGWRFHEELSSDITPTAGRSA
jgi:hypothetical protein